MLFERVTMDVVAAYRDRPDTAAQLEHAKQVHAWIDALPLDAATRAAVLEPIAAVEDGLREALRRDARDRLPSPRPAAE